MDTDILRMVKRALREVLEEEHAFGYVPLSDRWAGGRLVLQPGGGQKAKEIPVEDFFNKIILLRDRLRVLEQKVNAHPNLSRSEKIDLQQYVTKCYGSLTTFNVLFQDREDWFKGEGGQDS